MPEPIAITGIGTKFQRWNGAAFVDIARVFGLSGPTMSRDVVEVTTYDSIEGYREKIGGLRDGGQITFSLNFRRSTYLIFKGDFESDTAVDYQVVLPDTDATTMTFSGLVVELPLTVPEGDRITVDITIEISGKVTTDDET